MKKFMKKIKKQLAPIKLDKTIEDFFGFIHKEHYYDMDIYDDYIDVTEWEAGNNDTKSLFYLDDKYIFKFKEEIIPFAIIDDIPIVFTFWKKDKAKSMSDLPIVIFNDAGDFKIVANNIYDFIKIFYFIETIDDIEITWQEDIDDLTEEIDKNPYLIWMKKSNLLGDNFSSKHIISIPEKAQKNHGKDFYNFILSISKKRTINSDIYTMDFLSRLSKDSYNFFFKYAGCIDLGIDNINELEGSPLSHEESEFITVYDNRSKNKTFAIEERYIVIPEVTIKLPERFGINYNKKSPDICVDTSVLFERYKQISYLITYWTDMDYLEPLSIFKSKEERDEAYLREKEYFIQDPYLALYWLVYFGIHFDSRYKEVKTIVLKNKLDEKLKYLKEPIEFFEVTKDISTFKEKVLSSIEEPKRFLERLSYDMWLSYLYKHIGGKDSYKQWLATLNIYPEVDKYLIRKVRWVKNNIKEFMMWNNLNQDFIEIEDIPLASYIQACNPKLPTLERLKYAKQLISDLNKYKKVYSSNLSQSFAQIMLWDIKDIVDDKLKDKYRKIVEHYFSSNKTSKEYLDILKDTFREVNEETYIVAKYLDKLKNIDISKEDSYKEIVNLLSSLDSNIVLSVIENVISNASYALKYYLFEYLYMSNIDGKKDLLLKLFIVSAYSPDYFLKKFHTLTDKLVFKDKGDENFLAIKESLEISDKMLLNYGVDDKYDISDIRGTSLLLIGLSVRKSFVFEYLIDFINKTDNRDMQKYFYENFAKGYSYYLDDDCEELYKFFPTELFNKEQYVKYVDTLILRGVKDYEYELKQDKTFIYSYSISSLGQTKINKEINLQYVYDLIHSDKLNKFKLPQEIVPETKNALHNLLKESLFEKLESFCTYILYPIAGSFKYSDDFISLANKNREFKDNLFLWAKYGVDWQYGTYSNIIPILKELLEDKYLYAVPFASHGNEYSILDIYIFDSSIKSGDVPIYKITQDSEKKWIIEKRYNNFKQFKTEIDIKEDESYR